MRLGFVLLAFLQGVGVLIYIVLWLVMPEQVDGKEGTRSGFDSMTDDLKRIGAELRGLFGRAPMPAGSEQSASDPSSPAVSSSGGTSTAPATRQSLALGVLLVIVGLILLGANAGLVQWSVIWPTVLILVGVLLLARTLDRRH